MNNQETLLETIKNIPLLVERQTDNFQEIKESLKEVNVKKIVVIASGTSHNAAEAIKFVAWKNYNIQMETFYPNVFIHNFSKENFDKNTLYIFISQGGKTLSTIKSIEMINDLGGITLSLTEKKESPVAEVSTIPVEIGSINEKYVFRTAGYSMTVFTLYLIFLSIAENIDALSTEERQEKIAQLKDFPDYIHRIIKVSEQWYEEHKENFEKVESIFIAAGSEVYPVAAEAQIKLMEMVPIHAIGFEIEELIHGPQNLFDDTIAFFLMVNNEHDLEKATSIGEFLNVEMKVFHTVVSNIDGGNENQLKLYDGHYELDSILFATFIQVVSYKLAIDRGRDLSERLNASIDYYIKKALK